jgi:hypothetical protein
MVRLIVLSGPVRAVISMTLSQSEREYLLANSLFHLVFQLSCGG